MVSIIIIVTFVLVMLRNPIVVIRIISLQEGGWGGIFYVGFCIVLVVVIIVVVIVVWLAVEVL